MTFSQFLPLLVAATALYVLYKIYGIPTGEASQTIADIPGLSSGNVFIGNVKEIMFSDQAAMHEPCIREYGTTFKFKGVLWKDWLFTVDTKAISHILKKDTDAWQKPPSLAYNMLQVLGPGVLLADSDLHRKQRKILNPAFAPAEIKNFTETFLDKAVKLRDIWTSLIQQNGHEARIDVLSWLGKATLDAIGETGFGYKFDTLTEDPHHKSDLHEAFKVLFDVGTAPRVMRVLRGLIPITRYLPNERDAETAKAKKTMDRIGRQLLSERKLTMDSQHSGKPSVEGNDLLSLLVRANVSDGGHQRLSDEHVLAQIPTFIIAGHETTSTGITWALFSLAQDQTIQTTLRRELLAVPTENPTMDELNSLPYLDAVIRETLRFHAPVPATVRQATEDDVLPLQNPVVDKFGKVHHELRIAKGQIIVISIATLHRLESIWGKDANKFNPDRWSSPPKAATSIPGVWGDSLAFFGGPRACIGYRFSLIEMKALLFTLIRAFEFRMAVPAEDIVKRSEIVARPMLRTDLTGPNQLPLLVRPVVH